MPSAEPAATLHAALSATNTVPAALSIGFVVALPLRNEAELDRLLAAISNPDSPQYRHFLTGAQFAARYAPLAVNLEAVRSDLQRAGFSVNVSDQAVSAFGSQMQIERYFRTSLIRSADGVVAPRTTHGLPEELAAGKATIIGLDGTPPLDVDSRSMPMPSGLAPNKWSNEPLGPYYPTDLKQAYAMPSIQDASGRGTTIGVVMASPVDKSDIQKFFAIIQSAQPSVTTINVDGGGKLHNHFTFEATLDVEQSAGVAPAAHILLYNIRNLKNASIYDGYAEALKGDAGIISSSFGTCEQQFSKPSGRAMLVAFDALFKEGLARGFTWVASSGDYGKYSCRSRTVIGVDWPAVSPYVLAVGGTNLVTSLGSNDANYVSENAFHDEKPSFGGTLWGSGGGYSLYYKQPAWQRGFVANAARGVPDVSLHMGGLGYSTSRFSSNVTCVALTCNKNDSSDVVVLDGDLELGIGTSASAPDIAGLLALGSEIAGKPLGDVHAMLYAAAKHPGLFHTGIPGNNGFPTTKGLWDPVLGLGTPKAAFKIVDAKDAAGTPGSSSNP
jgi:subtilase family serine protease